MQKPNGYEEAQASGEFTPVNLGGHHAVIMQVTEKKSSTGKDMIVVVFDFAKNDEQAGYFNDRFKNDTRDDKKWPFNGTKYIMVNDYQDANKTSRQFKTFCTCFEKSNGTEVNWGLPNWGAQFKGKTNASPLARSLRGGTSWGNGQDVRCPSAARLEAAPPTWRLST